MTNSPTNAPASPCIRNCCLDDQDICIGCYRTLAEILQWTQYTAAEKLEVLNLCRARQAERHQRF